MLRWRRTELQKEEALLGYWLAERQRLEHARDNVLAARERTESGLRAAGSVLGSELAALAGYCARLERQRADLERQRAQCDGQIAAQRARVVDTQRRLRLLEKLRGRRLEDWRAASQREAENFASETFLARWERLTGNS